MSFANMSFSNMNPADRMKASVLLGLIVVVLFVAVHFVLGAVSPKKAAGQTASTQVATGIPGPAAAPNLNASQTPVGVDFPTTKDNASSSRLKDEIGNGLNIKDPFIPIRGENKSSVAWDSTPTVGVKHPSPFALRPGDGAGSGHSAILPPLFGPPSAPSGSNLGGPSGPASLTGMTVTPVEPEIRLIGVVAGDPSVATVEVNGRIILIRPWDAVARDYRLISVGPDGIAIRHQGEIITLRVGSVINEAKTEVKP